MTKHVGKNGTVYVAGTVVAEVRSFTLNENTRMAEATAAGDTGVTSRGTFTDASGTVTCWRDPTDTNGQGALTNGAEVALELGPEGSDSGDSVKELTALIEQVTSTLNHDGYNETTFSFRAKDGAVTTRTVTS